jgi:hypothetical protein
LTAACWTAAEVAAGADKLRVAAVVAATVIAARFPSQRI